MNRQETVGLSRMFRSAPCCYANFNALLENISRMSGKMLRSHWACGWSDVLRWEQTPSLNSKRGHSLLLEGRLCSLFTGGLRQQLSPRLHCRESRHHMSRLTVRLAFFFFSNLVTSFQSSKFERAYSLRSRATVDEGWAQVELSWLLLTHAEMTSVHTFIQFGFCFGQETCLNERA